MRIEHLRVVPTPFTSFDSSCIFAAWDDHERHVTFDLKINFLYCLGLDVFVGLYHKLCQFLGGVTSQIRVQSVLQVPTGPFS